MRYRLPTDLRRPSSGLVLAGLVSWLAAGPLPAGSAQEKPTDEKAEHAEFLDDARHYVIRTMKPEVTLKLHEPAIQNFTNPERNQERGSVFVWLNEGRPAVLGQFFRFDIRGERPKKHALHTTSAGPLEATFRDRVAWAPDQPGVEWAPYPAAPAVAATRTERLLQMRQIARAFQVKLHDPRGAESDLRLAARPLFDYSAPRVGVTDGALFSFMIATDPEAILMVEAFAEHGKLGFRYAFARFHFWKLTAKLADRTVWEVEYDRTQSGNTFADPRTMKKVYNSFHVTSQ
jgi:hypothetical protein